MIRRAAAVLLPQRRLFSTSEVPAADDLFAAAWRRVVPNVDLPKTPLAFFSQPLPTPSTTSDDSMPSTTSDNSMPSTNSDDSMPTPSKLSINLISRYSSHFSSEQVDMVIAPAVAGEMSILPGHVASISELKPGLLSIHEGDEVTKYFISSGFAYVHSDSAIEIIAEEAVPVEQIDPASVQKDLAEFTPTLSTASTDAEKAEAQIGIDVLTALNASLAG